MSFTNFLFFLLILVGTLLITYWASQREASTREFFAVSHSLNGFQNGLAIAGDYMSAASFLGITGAVALYGLDGFYYATGFLVSYLFLMLLVAEPFRRLGKYTLADAVCSRFPGDSVRLFLSSSSIAVCILYMIPQLVAAGLLIHLMLGLPYGVSVFLVGGAMTVYIVFGGMAATSWVQIVKTVVLVGGVLLLVLIVLARFDWDLEKLAQGAALHSPYGFRFFDGGHLFQNPLETLSLHLSLVLGTAGLPHILLRFFTVRQVQEVRRSLVTATWVIGLFYFLVLILGLAALVFVGYETIATEHPTGNLAAPLLAREVGGHFFMAFIAAVAFSTILAVVTGLMIAASASFAHDVYNEVLHGGRASDREQLTVARWTAFAVGAVSTVLALGMREANVTVLVSLTFVVAAATHVPVLLFTFYWRGFTRSGVFWGVGVGFISSLFFVLLDLFLPRTPNGLFSHSVASLDNPGLITIPLGFLACFLGSLFSSESADSKQFTLVTLAAETGGVWKSIVKERERWKTTVGVEKEWRNGSGKREKRRSVARKREQWRSAAEMGKKWRGAVKTNERRRKDESGLRVERQNQADGRGHRQNGESGKGKAAWRR